MIDPSRFFLEKSYIYDTPVIIKPDNFVCVVVVVVVKKANDDRKKSYEIYLSTNRSQKKCTASDDQSKVTCARIKYVHPFVFNPVLTFSLHIPFFSSLRFNSPSISLKNR